MMKSIDKAVGLARDLTDQFKIRFAGGSVINTVRQSQDAGGWPMIFLSASANEAEAQPIIVLRIMNIDVGAVDVFGNATMPFAPHQCEIAFELSALGAMLPNLSDYTKVVHQVARTGMIVIQEPIANANPVNESTMNTALAAGPSTVIRDIDWRNSGNV